ncbi:MAG: response regulator [Alcanivorax sediminis]|uniref:Response regulator n=1 Tax=Alcanivorax sediminis TaxID=2663008 RepID=A0A6N7LWX8_9GAMM|nr:response regulator [Alcanivorax sediminis]MQX53595.1 response regulator [Alcanivorax sediminis]
MEAAAIPHKVKDRLSILVVDDSTAVRSLIIAKLYELAEDNFDIEVFQAADGNEAITCAERATFDLIFLDVEMPGMGGLEACAKLRDMGVTARIAMLSSITSAESHMAGHKAGCNNYLVKPPHDSDLRSVMRLTSLMKQTSA